MNKQQLLKNILISVLSLSAIHFHFTSSAQLPDPALIGYFQNWHEARLPYIQLDAIDSRYNIVNVSFAIPKPGSDYDMQFIPDRVSPATFISQIKTLQTDGKKVFISIGGATAPVSLDNTTERDVFINSVNNIINTYGFDGIDIDLEGSSLSVTGGTITAPEDEPMINLIYAIRQIMSDYHTKNNRSLFLTMAPETAFVQGGQSRYEGIWGAYLPVIEALRDSIDILHVQLYNSGSMYGIDRKIYQQGTADFIVAMCEAVIQGFNTAGGKFTGLPANKIAVALPACSQAAGGGFTEPETVRSAINYLMGKGPKPGNYTLRKSGGYPDLRAMMTWSINWDASSACGGIYEFAGNFEEIFGETVSYHTITESINKLTFFPNPVKNLLKIKSGGYFDFPRTVYIFNTQGQMIYSKTVTDETETIDFTDFSKGVYFIRTGNSTAKIVKL